MVTLPKRYLISGYITVSEPRPSHRLSRAYIALAPHATTDIRRTNERPSLERVREIVANKLVGEIEHVARGDARTPLLYFDVTPAYIAVPPRINLLSGSHTISWLHGTSITSNSSMSQSLPSRRRQYGTKFPRRRPISRITLGALWALTTYISVSAFVGGA